MQTERDKLLALAERVSRLGPQGDNHLDVQVEVALFNPGGVYTAARPNYACSKVVYTDKAGNNVVCWAEDWTIPARRKATIAALRTKGGSDGQ